MMRINLAFVAASTLAGCSALDSVNPIEEAKALNAAAESCMLDVRDKRLKYEDAPSCQNLGSVSKRYIESGGQTDKEPVESQLIAEQALRMAWTAKAISASNNQSIALW